MHEVLVEKVSKRELCDWSTFKWNYAYRAIWYAKACVCIKLMEKLWFSLPYAFKMHLQKNKSFLLLL